MIHRIHGKPPVPESCARYWGSDGTLCSTHNGRFLSDTSTRCERRNVNDNPTSEPVVTRPTTDRLDIDALTGAVMESYRTRESSGGWRERARSIAAIYERERAMASRAATPDSPDSQEAENLSTSDEARVTQPTHVHEYAPNGLVRESAMAMSPVSVGDHTLYDKVFSVGLCPCGDVTRTHVANENVRTQAEEWRREAARR